ncbi:glycosyl hydrolase 9C2, partial [Thalictrum thalictroides]
NSPVSALNVEEIDTLAVIEGMKQAICEEIKQFIVGSDNKYLVELLQSSQTTSYMLRIVVLIFGALNLQLCNSGFSNAVQVLAAKFLMQGKAANHLEVFERYQEMAEYFMCSCIGKGSRNVPKTPRLLITSSSFLTTCLFLLSVLHW